MPELLQWTGTVSPVDTKTYRTHTFEVPQGTGELQVTFDYDPVRDSPHSLLTLGLYDSQGFRGAGHRFGPHQVVRVSAQTATPGFVPGPLEGKWTLEVCVFWAEPAPDARPSAYSVVVESRPVPHPLRLGPSSLYPAGRWYKGDLHLHTNHSDGSWTGSELVDAARQRGLDYIALTDHNTITGLPEIMAAGGNGLLVLPGMELTTFFGHALSLGLDRWIDWRTEREGRTIEMAAREVLQAGGLFAIVHSDSMPDAVCTGCHWSYDDFDLGLAQAVQVWGGYAWDSPEELNEKNLKRWHGWLNDGCRLPLIGGTDAHGPDGWRDNSGWTFVWAEELTAAAILAGIRAGHTFVSSGPELYVEASGEGGRRAGMGDTLAVGAGRPTIHAAWDASLEARLQIVVNGQVRLSQRSQGEGHVNVTAERGDRWANAELWNERQDMLLAITSPVYFE